MAAVSLGGYSNNTGIVSSSFSHAVSRSSELLSCAKTSLKIAKSQYSHDADAHGWWSQDPNSLQLHNKQQASLSQSPVQAEISGLLEDGLSLLRAMDAELVQLEKLVRRRGHTNDPTEEIAVSVQRLETDAKELSLLVTTGFPQTVGKQHQKHLTLVASWLQSVASQQTKKLKEILKVRGNVLADQAQRRKFLNPHHKPGETNGITAVSGTITSTASSRTASMSSTPWDSPLFTMTQPTSLSAKSSVSNGHFRTATGGGGMYGSSYVDGSSFSGFPDVSNTTSEAIGPKPKNPALAGGSTNKYQYGSGYGGHNYNGGYQYSYQMESTGMRQRKNAAASISAQKNDTTTSASYIEAQIQERQQQRQTESRLQEARQVERTLADLGNVFSRMSTLIVQQGETLEKVEDDVEVALGEVTAGQEEITTLYSIKKGNRGLIIKVFGLLIFLIIFLRFYKK